MKFFYNLIQGQLDFSIFGQLQFNISLGSQFLEFSE